MSKTLTTRIESYDVAPDGTVRLSALFKIFQKIAGDDLDSCGLTYNRLRDEGVVFVLTKMIIRFFDDINVYDDITIITRPRGCKGAIYVRDYDLYKNGIRVAYCTSQWVIIDFNTRKILRPSTIAEKFLLKDDLENIYPIENKKFKLVCDDMQSADVRKVYYSHMDRNRHMNNTFYPDIVLDYLPDCYKGSYTGKTVTIHYTTEITCGEEMEIYTGEFEGSFALMAVNTNNGKEVFSALVQGPTPETPMCSME
ncbi:MAG: hypothetical protein IJ365_07085 [Clostridia bacterium]|nr:hypothetical protein [Clostridia bacterium]